MSCCSEGGEILVFPVAGGFDPRILEEAEGALRPISSFDEAIAAFEADPEGEEGRATRPDAGDRARPWVAMAPEDELDGWVTRLNQREDIAVACPNWRLSLADPSGGRPMESVDFDPGGAARFLARNCEPAKPGAGAGAHVVVIDSGISPAAVYGGPALHEPQIDLALFGACLRTGGYDSNGHGSLVGSLIHQLAPAARISSIRTFRGNSATLSEVIYGLLSISHLGAPAQLVNLSFSVGAAIEACGVCGKQTRRTASSRGQLAAIFEQLHHALDPCPLFVAAAGSKQRLASPASIPGVIAVDSAVSLSPVVPARDRGRRGEEFVLAPGGSAQERIEIAAGVGLFGSSFATAVATGLLAREPAQLLESLQAPWPRRVDTQRWLVESLADSTFDGYDWLEHGLGVLS